MLNAEATLIKELTKRQNTLGLNDSNFASQQLKLPRTTWVQHKNMVRPLGLTLLRAVVRTYPDLNEAVLAYLRDGSE